MRLEKAERIAELAREIHGITVKISKLEAAEHRDKASAWKAEERLMQLERKLNEAMRQLHSMTF